MDQSVRALIIYLFVILVFRFSGKRTLQQLTVVDFVLLLIISEATNQGMLDEDHSLTNAFLIIAMYVMLDVLISRLEVRSGKFNKLMDNVPEIIVRHGVPVKKIMDRARVKEQDVLEKARELHGLENMSQIKYAILESNGEINIIPEEKKE